MKKIEIKLTGFKVVKNQDTLECQADYSELVKVKVESNESDAFDNDCPNADWLESLAEKKLGHLFQMDGYKIEIQ